MFKTLFILLFVAAVFNSVPAVADQLTGSKAAYDRKDFQTALKLMQPLAEQGNAEAQATLGMMYERGEGVTRNYAEAKKWYLKAAEQGDQRSQVRLGLLYMNNPGKDSNWQQAYYWYSVAGVYNWSIVAALYLTAEQKAAEDKKVKEWRAQHGEPSISAEARLFEKEALAPKDAPRKCVPFSDAEVKKLIKTACSPGTGCREGIVMEDVLAISDGCAGDDGLKWTTMVAEHGDCMTQTTLEYVYEGKKDYAEALFWEQVSMKYCHTISLRGDTFNWDEVLETHLTPQKIAEIKKRVADWKPTPPTVSR